MGLGLENLGSLSDLLESNQKPMELSIDLIDEDINQPRNLFDEEKLNELASTIKIRGVKQPISVRESKIKGRYIVNHGARRLRASIIAGKASIPAFIDNDFMEEDQLIENLQRNNLSPMEIATFIQKRLESGMKKGEVAKIIGKSPAYITQHINLLNLPKPIAEVFQSNRCQDVTVLNELVTVYKENPQEVTDWIANDSQDINRGGVRLLREFITEVSVSNIQPLSNDLEKQEQDNRINNLHKKNNENKKVSGEKINKAIVSIAVAERSAQLILTKRPSLYGQAWVKYEDDGSVEEIPLEFVKIIAVVEG